MVRKYLVLYFLLKTRLLGCVSTFATCALSHRMLGCCEEPMIQWLGPGLSNSFCKSGLKRASQIILCILTSEIIKGLILEGVALGPKVRALPG